MDVSWFTAKALASNSPFLLFIIFVNPLEVLKYLGCGFNHGHCPTHSVSYFFLALALFVTRGGGLYPLIY